MLFKFKAMRKSGLIKNKTKSLALEDPLMKVCAFLSSELMNDTVPPQLAGNVEVGPNTNTEEEQEVPTKTMTELEAEIAKKQREETMKQERTNEINANSTASNTASGRR